MNEKMLKKINNLEEYIFLQTNDILKVFDLMTEFKVDGMLEETFSMTCFLEEYSRDIYNRMRRLMSSVFQLGTMCQNMGPFSDALYSASQVRKAVTLGLSDLLRNAKKNKSVTRTSIENLRKYVGQRFEYLNSDIEQVVNDVRKELEE